MEFLAIVLSLLFGLIVFSTMVSFGLLYLGGRAAWRGGRRLMGWVRRQRNLPGTRQQPSAEARDVVVEPVEDVGADGREAPTAAQEPRLRKSRQRGSYVRLDVDAGATSIDITRVLRRYQTNPVLGRYAVGVADTLESADLRREALFAELDATFTRGTISWDRFASPASAALDAILRNCASLANRIQSFDVAAYQRLSEQTGTLAHGRGGTRERRREVFEQTLSLMDSTQDANESLLLELDKLQGELVNISSSDANGAEEAILSEIRKLVDEAKYYR